MTPTQLEALEGTELPPGEFRIDPDDHRRAMAVIKAPDYEGPIAHPMYGHIALNGGMGIEREAFFALCGSTLRTGALFGRGVISIHRPLTIGTEYTVRGAITSAVRKRGRRAGTFDLITVHLSGFDGRSDDPAVEMDETYVFLRDGDA